MIRFSIILSFLLFSLNAAAQCQYATIKARPTAHINKNKIHLPDTENSEAYAALRKEKDHNTILNTMAAHGWKFKQVILIEDKTLGAWLYFYFERCE